MKTIIKSISVFLTSQLFSICALVFALYVLFAVPQISNLWMQMPPFSGGVLVSLLFFVFVLLLGLFYGGSLVLNYDWKRYGQDNIRSDQPNANPSSKSITLWRLVVFLPKVASEWLLRSVFGKGEIEIPSTPKWKSKALGLSILSLLCSVLIYAWGATKVGSRGYTLAGAYCQFIGIWFLLFGIWLIFVRVFTKTDHHPFAINLLFHAGRLLGWILATSIVGELLWIAACLEIYYLSFRLFTIWAMVETLVAIILIAQLLDSLSRQLTGVVRLAAVAGLIGVVWTTSHSDLVDENEVKQHLSITTKPLTSVNDKDLDELWFNTFEKRLSMIDEGPFVFIAASGGGSRAAIFTSLCLSLLERTPLDPNLKLITKHDDKRRPRTWADQIVMLSSVSGGSLATAYWLQRWGAEEKDIPNLVHTTKRELIHYLEQFTRQSFLDFPNAQKLQGTLDQFKIVGTGQAADLATKWVATIEEMSRIPGADDRLDYIHKKLDALYNSREDLRKTLLSLLNQASAKATQAIANKSDPALQQQIAFVNTLAGSLDQFFACYWTYRYFHMLKEEKGNDDELQNRINGLKDFEFAALSRYRWILENPAFDAMCTDFMAPLFRGVLGPTLDRGDALAKFWTERFQWQDCTNLRGFMKKDGELPYSQGRPLAVLNACDAAMGCRLAIGFPDLPQNLWRTGSTQRPEYLLPETYREVAKPIELSLARAVRFSSNFPFGFRAQQLKTTQHRENVNVLDGGVSDNTGVDTIYEMLGALENHANNSDSSYASRAKKIMGTLKKRGIVILEIDSGGKPSAALPHGPLAGIFLPVQALNNAAYSTAAIAKSHYYLEIERRLKCSSQEFASILNLPGNPTEKVEEGELGVYYFQLPSLFIETALQCNHYSPDDDKPKTDVMTAWSLGPKDKSEVVGRFLQELTHWEGKRELLREQIGSKNKGFQTCKVDAETSIYKSRLKSRIDSLLNKITEVLNLVSNHSDTALRSTIENLMQQAKSIEDEISQFQSRPEMEDAKQWKGMLSKTVQLMIKTQNQLRTLDSTASKTGTASKEKVIEEARNSFNVVKQSFTPLKSPVLIDNYNRINVLKQRDAQVRQYYDVAKQADKKTASSNQTQGASPKK